MFKTLENRTARGKSAFATLAGLAVLCSAMMGSAQAIPLSSISQVYFFGDSLSDSGFNDYFAITPGLPAGKAPTFTTYSGYTWSQYVTRDIKNVVLPEYPLGSYPFPNPPDLITNNTTPLSVPGTWPVSGTLTGIDYAAGGSTTDSIGYSLPWAPSLHAQVQNFINTHPAPLDPNAVYFIWSGANDFLYALTQGSLPPQCSNLPADAAVQCQLLTTADNAAKNIASEVALLGQRGAKRVVVLSLPNLGLTPFINSIAQATSNPALPGSMKTLTFSFNSMLNQRLGAVISTVPVKVLYVDVYRLLDNLVATTKAGKPYVVDGQAFTFTNYTTPACGTVSAIECPSGTPTGYVFADGLHPTDETHRVLSLEVESLLQRWI